MIASSHVCAIQLYSQSFSSTSCGILGRQKKPSLHVCVVETSMYTKLTCAVMLSFQKDAKYSATDGSQLD